MTGSMVATGHAHGAVAIFEAQEARGTEDEVQPHFYRAHPDRVQSGEHNDRPRTACLD
eukprot:COSAG01_NODE_744_length_13876_cov_4.660449_21_plen_58_part_00